MRKGVSQGNRLWRGAPVAAAAVAGGVLLMGTRKGRLLAIPASQVPGRRPGARGVLGMRLDSDDFPEGLCFFPT